MICASDVEERWFVFTCAIVRVVHGCCAPQFSLYSSWLQMGVRADPAAPKTVHLGSVVSEACLQQIPLIKSLSAAISQKMKSHHHTSFSIICPKPSKFISIQSNLNLNYNLKPVKRAVCVCVCGIK